MALATRSRKSTRLASPVSPSCSAWCWISSYSRAFSSAIAPSPASIVAIWTGRGEPKTPAALRHQLEGADRGARRPRAGPWPCCASRSTRDRRPRSDRRAGRPRRRSSGPTCRARRGSPGSRPAGTRAGGSRPARADSSPWSRADRSGDPSSRARPRSRPTARAMCRAIRSPTSCGSIVWDRSLDIATTERRSSAWSSAAGSTSQRKSSRKPYARTHRRRTPGCR